MDINYELYKVFYYVASTLSFSEASKQLFISQSAVSQSIKALEKKLDQTLFIRSTKKVRLTTEGEILLRHIEPAISLIKRGESQLLDVGARGGQLHIGASDTICRYFLVPYLERFHREFPGAHIKVTNATSIRCVELLETGQVDLIVVNSPNSYLGNVPNVKKIKDFQDVFIANEAFKELKGKKVSFKELLDYPILMLDRKSTTSEYLHNLFLQNQLDLVPEIELSSNDLLIDLARIAQRGNGRIRGNLSGRADLIFLREHIHLAFAEEIVFLVAVRAYEIGHVLDQAKHRNLHRLCHIHRFCHDHAHQLLRRSDHDDAIDRQRLKDCERNIARSWRHVNEQIIDITPHHITPKLLDHPSDHRATPNDRIGIVFKQQIGRHDLRAIGCHRRK